MVSSVAYSPNGRHIISRSYDFTIQIWDAETGAPVDNPLEGHTLEVFSIAYSPDGCCIISGSFDAPFESGMLRLVLKLAILSRGTLTGCILLLIPLMANTSSPDLMTTPFKSGMQRLVCQ